jgi:hypothetical protein
MHALTQHIVEPRITHQIPPQHGHSMYLAEGSIQLTVLAHDQTRASLFVIVQVKCPVVPLGFECRHHRTRPPLTTGRPCHLDRVRRELQHDSRARPCDAVAVHVRQRIRHGADPRPLQPLRRIAFEFELRDGVCVAGRAAHDSGTEWIGGGRGGRRGGIGGNDWNAASCGTHTGVLQIGP